MKRKIEIFDTTLRDGAQANGINFSLSDKLHMLVLLDSLGIDYIEAGNPASNPKERSFFKEAKNVKLNHAKLVAFGSTKRKNTKVEEDGNVLAILSAETDVVTIFGKTSILHVEHVLKTTPEVNLAMVYDTVAYLKSLGKEVIFDAEHFFDGYLENNDYAIEVVKTAAQAGADKVVLCDTNGGAIESLIVEGVTKTLEAVDVCVGIHAHNDIEMAVANTMLAVDNGATHVQGTLLGFGERCGNARLSSIIPNLQIKKGYDCIPDDKIKTLYEICRKTAEIANIEIDGAMPYVGRNAFAHKGGMHIDGVSKTKKSFEHIEPETVGNQTSFLISEVAGKAAMQLKLQKDFPEVAKDKEKVALLMKKIKEHESEGYSFEGADGSFKLFVLRTLELYKPSFNLLHFRLNDEPSIENTFGAFAVVKVQVGENEIMTAAEGNGPVNALDIALRKALISEFKYLEDVVLKDYKVRVLDSGSATGASVRVMIESEDGEEYWTTIGVSSDVLEASLFALIDSIEYKIIKEKCSEL